MDELYDQLDDEEPTYDELEECPFCNGTALPMGSLGRSQWYRCENCGGEFSI